MNKAKITLVTIVATVLYSIAWFSYASYVKHVFTTNITESINNSDLAKFEYEDIAIGGFPHQVTLKINNAKGKLQTDKIIEKQIEYLDSKFKGLKKTTAPGIKWEDEFYVEGDLFITSSLFAKEYSLYISDEFYYKSNLNGKEITFLSKGGSLAFNVRFKKSPLFMATTEDSDKDKLADEIFSNVEYIAISGDENALFNEETNQVLYQSEEEHISLYMDRINSTAYHVELKMQTKNAEFITQDSFWETPFMQELTKQFSSSGLKEMSRRGKMNFDIHITYTGTTDTQKFKDRDFSFSLKVPKFIWSDDLLQSQLNSSANLTMEQGKLLDFQVVSHGTSKFNQKWYNYIIEDMKRGSKKLTNSRAVVNALEANNSDLPKEIKTKLNAIKLKSEFYSQASKVTPKLHEFGNIKHNIEFSFNDSSERKANIKQFDVITDLYGIKINGGFEGKKPVPDAKASVTFLNYADMTDELFLYASNTIPVFENALSTTLPIAIRQGAAQALKDLLRELSNTEDETSKDITITAQVSEKTPIPMVGNRNFFEAMLLSNTILSPHLAP